MLARLAAIAGEHAIPGEVAMETGMGCGYGACLGCAIRAKGERFLLCCKDGPAFDLAEVLW